jgi:SAM-dependent methyltransferase
MVATRFHVDRCDPDQVAGWIDQEGPVSTVTIEVNGDWVCDLSPTQFRADLLDAGLGDGRRAFCFLLTGYLTGSSNKISLRSQGVEFFCKYVVSPESETSQRLLEYSQRRWKGDEPDEHLTWGTVMDGTSLWTIYRSRREFYDSDRILEIGPGYGRLLSTAIALAVHFSSYIGLELSESRVLKLNSRFQRRNVAFVAGDVNYWRSDKIFDVIICSSTFEHLYPDCRMALRNLRTLLVADGWTFIDFIYSQKSWLGFEENTAFVRCYTESELHDIFRESGFDLIDIIPSVIGTADTGEPVTRNVVIARCGDHP